MDKPMWVEIRLFGAPWNKVSVIRMKADRYNETMSYMELMNSWGCLERKPTGYRYISMNGMVVNERIYNKGVRGFLQRLFGR
jgi:hypothetical protein